MKNIYILLIIIVVVLFCFKPKNNNLENFPIDSADYSGKKLGSEITGAWTQYKEGKNTKFVNSPFGSATDKVVGELSSDSSLEYPPKRQTSGSTNQYIYLDERFPKVPYNGFKDGGKTNSTKVTKQDYIVVPLPNVKGSGTSLELDEPTYILLRYKNKPINTDQVLTSGTTTTPRYGYCNNHLYGDPTTEDKSQCNKIELYDGWKPYCFDGSIGLEGDATLNYMKKGTTSKTTSSSPYFNEGGGKIFNID